MVERFDPYHKWLAISPKDQPPNHYRLLGIDLFELDPDVISGAADQRMSHVRAFQPGEHSTLSQKVLNEIAAARVCLLNLERRTRYDQQLRAALAFVERQRTVPPWAAVPPAPTTGGHPVAPPLPRAAPAAVAVRADSPLYQRRRRSGLWQVVTAITVLVAICVGSIMVVRWSGRWQGSVGQVEGKSYLRKEEPPPAPAAGTHPPDKSPDALAKPGAASLESELAGMLDEVRAAIARRDLKTAREQLKAAQDYVKSALKKAQSRSDIDELKAIGRVQTLLEANEGFWKAVRAAADRLEQGDELTLDDNPIANVLEVEGNKLTIRWQGENLSCVIDERNPPEELPWELAVALAERVVLLGGNTPPSLEIGAFLAVDKRGNRTEARRRLGQSGKLGEELMHELDLAGPVKMSWHGPTGRSLGQLGPKDGQQRKPGEENGEAPRAQVTRRPVPDPAEQQKIRRVLDDIYDTASPRKPDGKLKLAGRLAALAEKAENSTERFVLLRRACELAFEGGEAGRMLDLVARIADEFKVDRLRAQTHMLNEFAEKASNEDRIRALLVGSAAVINDAMDSERFEVADSLSSAVYRACQSRAGRPFRREALERRREVESLRDGWSQVQAARVVLQSNPDDEAAHTTVGRWHCFVRDDWEQALPHFAKGSEPELKALAVRELSAPPTDAVGQVELADAWWELAQISDKEAKPAWLARAAFWYEHAHPKLTSPLAKAKVAKRLADAGRPVRPDGQYGLDALRRDNPELFPPGERRLSDLLEEPAGIARKDHGSNDVVPRADEECPTCKGKGVIYTKCKNPRCKRGTVRVYQNQVVGVNPVTGQQIVRRVAVRVTCPTCQGNYIKKETCPDCKGRSVK